MTDVHEVANDELCILERMWSCW